MKQLPIDDRRSFIKRALTAAGTASVSGNLLADPVPDVHSGRLNKGDAAILRFLAAAEILETDFWVQYNELGGIQDSEVPGGSGSAAYTAALEVLDADMAQYIHDNTEDEFTHQNFINAYLASKGADTVNLDQFRTLPSSKATGSSGNRTTHKPHAAHRGHQLVDSVPQPREQPRSRSQVRVSPSSPGFEQRAVSGNSQIRCRSNPRRPHPGNCQHGGIPLSDYRARWQQPLPVAGSESKQRGSLANPAQHRPNRDSPLSDLARQGGQCASSDRPHEWTGVSGPQFASFWRGRLPDQPDHA